MGTQERQKNIRQFIDQEVFACQSSLVDEALKKELFSWDDIQNLYRPFDGMLIAPTVCYTCKGEYESLDSETGQCKECYEANQEPQEIFEWWLISKWFAEKLMEAGEPVLENEYGRWWGRTTTGQSIEIDYVINKTYDEAMSF